MLQVISCYSQSSNDLSITKFKKYLMSNLMMKKIIHYWKSLPMCNCVSPAVSFHLYSKDLQPCCLNYSWYWVSGWSGTCYLHIDLFCMEIILMSFYLIRLCIIIVYIWIQQSHSGEKFWKMEMQTHYILFNWKVFNIQLINSHEFRDWKLEKHKIYEVVSIRCELVSSVCTQHLPSA